MLDLIEKYLSKIKTADTLFFTTIVTINKAIPID